MRMHYVYQHDEFPATFLIDEQRTFREIVEMFWDVGLQWGPHLWLQVGGQLFNFESWGDMRVCEGDLFIDMGDDPTPPQPRALTPSIL